MNVAHIAPLRDHLLVELQEKPKATEGGILLVNEETNTAEGIVVAVGPGVIRDKDGELIDIDVQVGDRVLYHNTAGIKVTEQGEFPIVVMLREEDVLAIVVDG